MLTKPKTRLMIRQKSATILLLALCASCSDSTPFPYPHDAASDTASDNEGIIFNMEPAEFEDEYEYVDL